MPWRGLEPRRLAAPPPQDGVSTNFTTRANQPALSCQPSAIADQNFRIRLPPVRIAISDCASCELSNTGATGLEPATSRVTVECSNQIELRPPCTAGGIIAPPPHLWFYRPFTVARRGIEPLSAP